MVGKVSAAAAVAVLAACCIGLIPAPFLPAQAMSENVVSRHLRIRIPAERIWLARESISDMERSWEFARAAGGGKLPGRVLIIVEWDDAASSVDPDSATISIGMADPAAARDLRGFLVHSAVRELSRLALITLSDRGASRPESRFLLDGMSEIIAHDFSNSVRRLSAAWAVSFYLDRVTPFSLSRLATWGDDAPGRRDLLAAAPGVTLLNACRERFGRERVLKLFEMLGERGLQESLAAAFRVPAAEAETDWLKRVRAYTPADITPAGAEEAPVLVRVESDPAHAGTVLSLRLFASDSNLDLTPSGIFMVDETGGRVLQGRPAGGGGRHFLFELPIEGDRPAGTYRVALTAIDGGGNVRNWEAHYTVAR
ncbi:MAG: hypothetical protein H6Q05_1676 [Acidobacteria bacterium]|nr:hypothetical protein [Acidobacteriota bacterium]